eukprot:TRINITY_DN7323_c0_g1_i1.p1 TRINITY_DN7323_c0_g1~~TRINITY_DN7323_c0_g1_i1.p1  ORF type:complete len:668 (+),score=96.61 TRINITY_DN7323_c0_g1_i1:68-2071(+)
MDSGMQLPGSVDDGPSLDVKRYACSEDIEDYLKGVIASLHQKLVADVNAALADVREQSDRLIAASCASISGRQGELRCESRQGRENIGAKECLRAAASGDSDTFPIKKRLSTITFTSSMRNDEDSDLITALFKKIDADGSGELTKSEFLRAFKTDDVVIAFCKARPALRPLLDHRTFKRAFETMDNDGSAKISFEEFKEAIGQFIDDVNDDEKTEPVAPAVLAQRSAFVTGFKQAALDEEVYDVVKFYWESGWSQQIARSDVFQNFTLAMIVVNAIYIGIDAEHNNASHLYEASVFFLVSEFVFCAFFSFEWMVRFLAFQRKCNCLRDGWFKFDSFLVLLMVVETILLPPILSSGSEAPPTGILRLLRLSRLSRLVRLMRSVPELVTIVKGMYAALRAVLSTFGMIVFLIYLFAIVMLLILRDDEEFSSYFSSLSLCMWTLLICGLFGNFDVLLNELVVRGDFTTTVGTIVFFIFIILATITVMNLLVGVLVNVVTIVADGEKEESATNLMKEQILYELKSFDDGDGLISEDELNEVMTSEKSVEVLESIGVDVSFLQTLQVMTYEDPDAVVPIHEILHQMLTCRRELPATMEHLILQTHLSIWMMSNKILQHERRMEKNLDMRFEKLLDLIGEEPHLLHRDSSAHEAHQKLFTKKYKPSPTSELWC